MIKISFGFDAHHVPPLSAKVFLTHLKIYALSALIILIGVSILVATGFLVAFLWSAGSGQYDDDYTPSIRMLFEDTPKSTGTQEKKISKLK